MRAIKALMFLLCCTASMLSRAGEPYFYALAYHDVRDDVLEEVDADQYALSTSKLIAHFSWLQENGYVPVTVDDILAARRGEKALPDKAVLLTFDDGLESVYTHVFPLLKLFNYPAVVSLVTGWTNGDVPLPTGDTVVEGYKFMTWDQAREMQASGLIEFASHSHNLHRGILGNPQGNLEPAAVTRLYTGTGYESDAEYEARIRTDLETSAALMERELGKRPRIITWPYGAFNQEARAIASSLGMDVGLTLTGKKNTPSSSATIDRYIVEANPDVDWLSLTMLQLDTPPIVRAAQIDLDYVYDEDEAQQEANLGMLLDRIKALKISDVFLQAFADPDGDGAARELYFPNRRLPMRADLFNRVAWQLKTRADVRVYAWLPVLAYEGDAVNPAWRVTQSVGGAISYDENSEPRLSPFDPEARAFIRDIYEDVAKSSDIQGVLFHDDGRLSELEDASPSAMRAYREAFGEDFSIEDVAEDPEALARWTDFKTTKLIELTKTLAAAVRYYRPDIRTARNLFSDTLLDPDGEIYHAQSFDAFLEAYDQVALMAMPRLENQNDPTQFYTALVQAVRARPQGFDKTIFELQTVDWRSNVRVPAEELRHTMRWLQSLGVKNIGYYPDDFIYGFPELDELKEGISLARFPIGVLR